MLSLEGCRTLCGRDFQYWPPKETAQRFLYFLAPLLILAIRFAFAAVGATNIPFVLIHLIGDPIDSIWSTLSRQELARRNYNLALELTPVAAVDVATILTTYDQWWQNARDHLRTNLERRNQRATHEEKASQSSLQPQSYAGDRLEQHLRHPLWRRRRTRSEQVEMDSMHPNVRIPRSLTEYEIYHIKDASHFLAENRKSPKLLFTWSAIVIFLVSLTGAYIRTATEKINNQTSHTLAVIMLFSFLVYAVYISSHVGNFGRRTVAIEAIEKLNEHVDLFSEVRLKAVLDIPEVDNASRYAPAASWAGINNSFRPDKTIPSNDSSDRSRWSLLTIAVLNVLVSFGAAFTLSYLTPAKGFGCRSFTWCVITAGWLISALLDPLFFFITGIAEGRIQVLWYITLVKDAFLTAASIGAVVIAQIGVMNSCWCRASAFSSPPKCIDIGPVTGALEDEGWLEWILIPVCGLGLIIVLIFISGYEGDNGRLLFSRTDAELQAEKKALKNMELLGLDQRPLASEASLLGDGEQEPPKATGNEQRVHPSGPIAEPQASDPDKASRRPPTPPLGQAAEGRVDPNKGKARDNQDTQQAYLTPSWPMGIGSSSQLLQDPHGESESLLSAPSYLTSREASAER
ncbi:MAG: hypothetical protein M1835_005351 [Candelina submexicana]|nr:MAG: hypothetical protein M1835_005351 [Candelina submexicana]